MSAVCERFTERRAADRALTAAEEAHQQACVERTRFVRALYRVSALLAAPERPARVVDGRLAETVLARYDAEPVQPARPWLVVLGMASVAVSVVSAHGPVVVPVLSFAGIEWVRLLGAIMSALSLLVLATLCRPSWLAVLTQGHTNPIVLRSARRWQRQSGDRPAPAVLAAGLCATAAVLLVDRLPVLTLAVFLLWGIVQGLARVMWVRSTDRDEVLGLTALSAREATFGYILVALAPTLLELAFGEGVLLALACGGIGSPGLAVGMLGGAILLTVCAVCCGLAAWTIAARMRPDEVAAAVVFPVGVTWLASAVHLTTVHVGPAIAACHAAVGVLVGVLLMNWWRKGPAPRAEASSISFISNPFLNVGLSIQMRAWWGDTPRQVLGTLLVLVPLAWQHSTAAMLTFLLWGVQLAWRHDAMPEVVVVTRMSPWRLFCGQLMACILPLLPVWMGYMVVAHFTHQVWTVGLLSLAVAVLGGSLGLMNGARTACPV